MRSLKSCCKLASKGLVASIVLLLLSSCQFAKVEQNAKKETLKKHAPITQQLIVMVNHNQDLKDMLEDSIAMAKEKNPDKDTNPAQTLEEYYDFVDWASKTMPWTILPNTPYSTLYEQIYQGLTYFYFINDQHLLELEDKGYFRPTLQYQEPYRSWLVQFVEDWGSFLNTPESWNNEYYKRVLADPSFNMDKGWYESPSNWKSFNDFFARHLKSPAERPIASPNNPSIVTAPADSTAQGVWHIDESSNIVTENGVIVKSVKFKSIAQLMGKKNPYKDAFANGTLTHMYLDVNDYHRYHFPVAGTIKYVGTIDGDGAVGGDVSWDPESGKYLFDADTPGWQNIQNRDIVVVDTGKYGLVAIMPVGMSQIASVNFEKNVKEGAIVKKGDPLGYFLFGGSDIILLFQSDVSFNLTVPKEKDTNDYEHIMTGEVYGVLSQKK
jgi:phosphatidylserine decarboxylase